ILIYHHVVVQEAKRALELKTARPLQEHSRGSSVDCAFVTSAIKIRPRIGVALKRHQRLQKILPNVHAVAFAALPCIREADRIALTSTNKSDALDEIAGKARVTDSKHVEIALSPS